MSRREPSRQTAARTQAAARPRDARPGDAARTCGAAGTCDAVQTRAVAWVRDAGTMSLELALLAPVLVAFMMLMVGLGRVVEAQSQVDGAARDAARAASIARTRGGAESAARDAAAATMQGKKQWCEGGPRTGIEWGRSQWRRGGQVTASVRCVIDLSGLSLIKLTPSKTMTGSATAPIDTLRRVR